MDWLCGQYTTERNRTISNHQQPLLVLLLLLLTLLLLLLLVLLETKHLLLVRCFCGWYFG
jgi:hypothetical protein